MQADKNFLSGAGRWTDALGGLRDTVRQELVAAQLAEAIAERSAGGSLRVAESRPTVVAQLGPTLAPREPQK